MFVINRQIFYFKYSPDSATLEGMPYKVTRPAGMSDADFNTMLNYFRKIVDETKVDGIRYANDTLMKHNINHFCLSGGTVLFKIVENQKMSGLGIPELYGYYTPISEARIMWLKIDKMFYLLASETPGSVKDGPIDHELLSSLNVGSVRGVKTFYKNTLESMVKELSAMPFPINAALTCIPGELYPHGVKLYDNGLISEKTDGSSKEIEIEFDEKKLRYTIGKCNQPLKGAMLVCAPDDDAGKKGGFFTLKKKNDSGVKAIRQWFYEYTDNGQKYEESCDFIKIDNAFEYSPVSDTFNSYTGRVGEKADPLPRVESAKVKYTAPPHEEEEVEETPFFAPEPPKKAVKSAVTAPMYTEPEKPKEKAVAPMVKPVKHEKPAKPEKQVKPEKPPKPIKPPKQDIKSKPEAKVHPLLAQAEERRATDSAASAAPRKPTPPPKPISPSESSRSKLVQGKVHPLLAQAEERRLSETRPLTPIRPEPHSSRPEPPSPRPAPPPRPVMPQERNAFDNAEPAKKMPPRRSKFGNTQSIVLPDATKEIPALSRPNPAPPSPSVPKPKSE